MRENNWNYFYFIIVFLFTFMFYLYKTHNYEVILTLDADGHSKIFCFAAAKIIVWKKEEQRKETGREGREDGRHGENPRINWKYQ